MLQLLPPLVPYISPVLPYVSPVLPPSLPSLSGWACVSCQGGASRETRPARTPSSSPCYATRLTHAREPPLLMPLCIPWFLVSSLPHPPPSPSSSPSSPPLGLNAAPSSPHSGSHLNLYCVCTFELCVRAVCAWSPGISDFAGDVASTHAADPVFIQQKLQAK